MARRNTQTAVVLRRETLPLMRAPMFVVRGDHDGRLIAASLNFGAAAAQARGLGYFNIRYIHDTKG